MDLTMSSFGKLITLAVILVVFGVVGWRVGAPASFNATLAGTGMVTPAAAAPAAPAQGGGSTAQ
jgi:hypothetical protein